MGGRFSKVRATPSGLRCPKESKETGVLRGDTNRPGSRLQTDGGCFQWRDSEDFPEMVNLM